MPDTELQGLVDISAIKAKAKGNGPEAVIVIGTPSGGSAPDEWIQTLFRMQFAAVGKYHLIPISCQGSSIAHNQNNIVAGARRVSQELVAAGCRPVDAIFFFENDEAFRNAEEVIDRLWKHNKPIVGCTYCFKEHDRIRVMGVDLDLEPIDWLSLYKREPLSKVVALPIGALMVRMEVFDTLDKEVFKGADADGKILEMTEAPTFQHDIHFGLKLVRTTDYVFCCRAAKAGYDIWLDAPLSLELEHWGKYPYSLPHPSQVGRQLATLQMLADFYAKESEKEGSEPHHRVIAEDLYGVVAAYVRRTGIFAYEAPREAAKEAAA